MNWLEALSHLSAESQGYVLLTVMGTRGSSPRDAGTKMVVSKDNIFDTIGGGALEYESIEIARGLLQDNEHKQHTETFNLGNDLKQCCGGVVSVFFEVFPAIDFTINIFGAGHIGQALSKILADIECKVNLYDSRAELLQKPYPKSFTTHQLSKPEIAVEACPAESYFLVMTHDHALDQQLCEAILSRTDTLYCGVIGSNTKGIKFRQRLKRKGFSKEECSKLTCPMGLGDLETKKPMEIAVSIVSELLILREQSKKSKQNIKTRDADIIHLETRD